METPYTLHAYRYADTELCKSTAVCQIQWWYSHNTIIDILTKILQDKIWNDNITTSVTC